MHATEAHADKTCSTRCGEFEIKTYDAVSFRIVTIARMLFEKKDKDSYFEVSKTVFDTAENDFSHSIPWGYIIADDKSLIGIRIQAILLDEHAGQIQGFAKQFHEKFPNDDEVLTSLKSMRFTGRVRSSNYFVMTLTLPLYPIVLTLVLASRPLFTSYQLSHLDSSGFCDRSPLPLISLMSTSPYEP